MAELVVALDFHSEKEAINMAEQIQGVAPWVKIGLELYISQGPSIVKKMKDLGFKVFLDLKLFDIPNTVKGATASAIDLGVDLLTIHLLGGRKMGEASLLEVQSKGSNLMIFGVSVLTSFAEGELPGFDKSIGQMVEILAQDAEEMGLHGIVCSGQEVKKMKSISPTLKFLTPGIRLDEKSNSDDQERIITPQKAVEFGSDFLVVGRPITLAKDPREVCLIIQQEMQIK